MEQNPKTGRLDDAEAVYVLFGKLFDDAYADVLGTMKQTITKVERMWERRESLPSMLGGDSASSVEIAAEIMFATSARDLPGKLNNLIVQAHYLDKQRAALAALSGSNDEQSPDDLS